MTLFRNMHGQVPIVTVFTLAASILITAFGSFVAADSKSQDRDFDQAQRISSLEAKIERLPIIEQKLDAMLLRSGINPSQFNARQPQ